MRAAPPILIVEDDVDVRDVVADVLRDEGHPVACAANGAEALEWLRGAGNPRPCVILLDLMMPRVDGRQFLQEQLDDPSLRDIPVILLSADQQLPAVARAAGVDAYLQKPIQLEALLQAVHRYSPRPRAAAAERG